MTHKTVTKSEQVRHTHSTINGLEDAIANVMNVIAELELALLRANRLLEVLQEVRRGPHSYQRGSRRRPRVTYLRGEDENKDQESESGSLVDG